jgi:hypothetical protein
VKEASGVGVPSDFGVPGICGDAGATATVAAIARVDFTQCHLEDVE